MSTSDDDYGKVGVPRKIALRVRNTSEIWFVDRIDEECAGNDRSETAKLFVEVFGIE